MACRYTVREEEEEEEGDKHKWTETGGKETDGNRITILSYECNLLVCQGIAFIRTDVH